MFDSSFISSWFSNSNFGVPETVALAVVAVIGYLFGHRTRHDSTPSMSDQVRRELKRASVIARDMEKIASAIRKDLAAHHGRVLEFKAKVAEFSKGEDSNLLKELCNEVEHILTPTLKLASQISHAYDQIRKQSSQLMTFAEGRTDPLTGISNRRALDEQLDIMISLMQRYDRPFSICIFDIDNFDRLNKREGRLYGDEVLKRIARMMNIVVRETDIVARYGGEEFVVVMPQTGLAGASIFGDRIRRLFEDEMKVTLSGGIAEANQTDTPQTILSRADSALYSAKANGRNCLFYHTGTMIRPYRSERHLSQEETLDQVEVPDALAPACSEKAVVG